MRKRRKSLLCGSILDSLRWRFDFLTDDEGEPTGGVSGGSTNVEQPDVEPVNGGPDRSNLANAEIAENPVNQPANPAAGVTQPRTPTDPNQRAGTAQPAQPAPPQWQSIREAAAAQNFQFDGTVTDDRTALNFLLAQANRGRQENVYAQLGRQLAPQANQIQAYLAQQTTPQPATPARQPWEAPEFDERWAGLVTQDPGTGLYTSNQGVPHEIAQKVNAYAEWKKNYDRNPAAVINGMVEQRAKAIATQTFQEQFAAQAREQTIGSIVAENRTWLYQVDQSGQQLRDFQGQYIPTPIGAAYIQQLRAVQQMGVTDPRMQDKLAKDLVRGQQAQAYQTQHWQAQQQAANPQTRQATGQPNVNPLQALPPNQRRQTPGATEPSTKGQSLAEMLRAGLAAEGVTDTDIFNSSGQS